MRSTLPVQQVIDSLKSALDERHEAVLQAPPGAGKTTAVPLALLDQDWLNGRQIWLLEPRRVAARAAADRMASLLNEKPGETVGYIMRQEAKVSAESRIIVMTEGVLSRKIQADPELAEAALIIFDEFHERNLDSDLGLALALSARDIYREDNSPLKLLVMSATLDGDKISALLNDAPIITSEGRSYDVVIQHNTALRTAEINIHTLVNKAVDACLHSLNELQGNVLVFLPGRGEIEKCMSLLTEKLVDTAHEKNVLIAPLHGSLSLEQQKQAISPLSPTSEFVRKLVIATDIAETSLTIEGTRIVIDSGVCRRPEFDPQTSTTRLHTRRISQASATQRAGRAGRQEDGVCFRLYSEEQAKAMSRHSPAEILQADLCPLALQLAQWGISSPSELNWLDLPPAGGFKQAQDLLKYLGALDTDKNLSKHGQDMAQLPCHPRLANMLLQAKQIQLLPLVCELAALLEEKDPGNVNGADIRSRLELLHSNSGNSKWRQRVLRQARAYAGMLKTPQKNGEKEHHDENIAYLLALAFPDRIGKRKHTQSNIYQLSNGRAAQLKEGDPLSNSEWLVAASIGGFSGGNDTVFLAHRFPNTLFNSKLSALCRHERRVEWDEKSQRFLAEEQQLVGKLLIERKKLQSLGKDEKQQALARFIQKQGLALLDWQNENEQLRARITLLRTLFPDEGWPDLNTENLLKTVDTWLLPHLDEVKTLQDFKKLPLKQLLMNLLPWQLSSKLEELAPTRLKVASGSSYAIDYSQTPPVLAVKLQEMFGEKTTPSVANGKQVLNLHLLSPAKRPLQITQDLAGFWQGSYESVKKEMKGRYPKHPWPDNPLEAQATRLTKKAQARQRSND